MGQRSKLWLRRASFHLLSAGFMGTRWPAGTAPTLEGCSGYLCLAIDDASRRGHAKAGLGLAAPTRGSDRRSTLCAEPIPVSDCLHAMRLRGTAGERRFSVSSVGSVPNPAPSGQRLRDCGDLPGCDVARKSAWRRNCHLRSGLSSFGYFCYASFHSNAALWFGCDCYRVWSRCVRSLPCGVGAEMGEYQCCRQAQPTPVGQLPIFYALQYVQVQPRSVAARRFPDRRRGRICNRRKAHAIRHPCGVVVAYRSLRPLLFLNVPGEHGDLAHPARTSIRAVSLALALPVVCGRFTL